MKPNGGGNIPSKLENKINNDFGNLRNLERNLLMLELLSLDLDGVGYL